MLVSARNLSIILLAACTFPALCVQAADIPLRGPVPFAAFDRDGNRMISPQEFVETHNQRRKMRLAANMPAGRMPADPAFTYFDTNGDNQISPDELNLTRQAMQQQRGGMRPGIPECQGMGRGMNMNQGQGRGMNRGMNMPAFSDFDLNGDGVLLAEEFYDARAKRMYQRGEQGYPMRNAANAPPFEALDSNRDRKVTSDEFAAHQDEHRRMMMGRQGGSD